MDPRTYEGSVQQSKRLKTFMYSKKIKLPLKRMVNNQTFFTSLRSYYHIIIACYTLCTFFKYFFSYRRGYNTKF